MATGPATQISDIVEPSHFSEYVQQITEEKARLIASGIATRNPLLDGWLGADMGGLTFNVPSFNDLDNDADRVSDEVSHYSLEAPTVSGSGTITLDPVPQKIEGATEVAVRLSRNNSWSSMDLTAAMAGADPMDAIANRVAYYWARRLQAAFIASMNGVIADNTANDSGDYTNDISGASFIDGVTTFSAEAFLDTAVTMGDSMEDLTGVMMHSVVYNKALKNNLIDFVSDSANANAAKIPTFLGRQVVVDDGMPVTSSVYDTWLFGGGAVQLGISAPKVATEIERKAGAGNGGGQEVLYNRVEWAIHPTGHAYTGGTTAKGGPGNGTGSDQLNNAGSWNRVYNERKQIKFARLVTREA